MKKYVAKRNEVMAGKLSIVVQTKVNDIFDNEEEDIMSYNRYPAFGLRGMIYNIDDMCANDLVFDGVQHYVVDGFGKINLDNRLNFAVLKNTELEDLLKYLKFKEDLTQKDIDKIFKMLIKHKKWLKNHSELFGLISNGYDGYEYDKSKELLPHELFYNLQTINRSDYKVQNDEPNYQLIKKRK